MTWVDDLHPCSRDAPAFADPLVRAGVGSHGRCLVRVLSRPGADCASGGSVRIGDTTHGTGPGRADVTAARAASTRHPSVTVEGVSALEQSATFR